MGETPEARFLRDRVGRVSMKPFPRDRALDGASVLSKEEGTGAAHFRKSWRRSYVLAAAPASKRRNDETDLPRLPSHSSASLTAPTSAPKSSTRCRSLSIRSVRHLSLFLLSSLVVPPTDNTLFHCSEIPPNRHPSRLHHLRPRTRRCQGRQDLREGCVSSRARLSCPVETLRLDGGWAIEGLRRN